MSPQEARRTPCWRAPLEAGAGSFPEIPVPALRVQEVAVGNLLLACCAPVSGSCTRMPSGVLCLRLHVRGRTSSEPPSTARLALRFFSCAPPQPIRSVSPHPKGPSRDRNQVERASFGPFLTSSDLQQAIGQRSLKPRCRANSARQAGISPMRPTGFEPATFGLKDRRSLGPRKDPLTAELRALSWKVTRAAGFERRRWG
jgi:hypothetical protein